MPVERVKMHGRRRCDRGSAPVPGDRWSSIRDVKTRNLSRAYRASWAIALALSVAGVAQAAPNAKAARLYEDALARFEKDDAKGAIVQLKNALQIDKSMLPVQVLLGRALLADGQVAAAEVAFTDALNLGVNRAEVVVPMAEAVMRQGNQKQVLIESRFAVAGLPAGVQFKLQLMRASAAIDLGDAREALRSIEQARTIDPGAPESWLSEVPVRLRARQFDEALAAADKALALSPGSAEAHYHRGQVLHLRGQLDGALAAYGKALASDPALIDALVSRAGLLIDLDRIGAAKADLDALRKASASDPRGAYLSALLAERAGDRAQARSALKEVTALIDPIPIAYIRLKPQVLMLNGLAHYGLGERENAKPYLEAYQRLDPGGGVSKLLAQIHLADGNVQLAIESLEAYLRANPNDTQAQALLASAHMSQGRASRATALTRDALRRNDAPELRAALGLSLLRSGQGVDAEVELEQAYKRDPRLVGAGAALVGLHLQQGKTDRALALAQGLVKSQPSSAPFQTLLGQAQLGAGKKADARRSFEQATRLDPVLLGPHLNLARLDASEGAFDAAAKRLTTLLSKDERNVEVQFELATLMELKGQPDEAQRWLEKAVAHSGPRETRAALALVDLHLRHGRKDKALEVAKAVSAQAPDDLAPHLALARTQINVGDRDGARLSLTTATRLAAYEAPQQLEIGLLQMLAGNLAGAAYSFDKALSSRPDYLPALAALVDVEIRQREYAKAEQRARAIAARVPQRSIGHLLVGDVAWAKGDLDGALDAFRRAHKAQPGSDTVLSLHSAILRKDGAAAAMSFLKQWLQSRPGDRVVRGALAGLQARSGQLAEARQGYESLLQAAPNDADLLNNLANVLLLAKSPEAVVVAERALAAAPGSTAVIDTLGWALFQNGQHDRALQLLRDARLRSPSNPTIRYHLAAVLAKTGRAKEAKAELTQALAAAPRFEGSDEARALLKSLQ